jgi:hypothetical protein
MASSRAILRPDRRPNPSLHRCRLHMPGFRGSGEQANWSGSSKYASSQIWHFERFERVEQRASANKNAGY